MTYTPPHRATDKSPRWYAKFLDNFPVGIYRTTLEGKLVFTNKAFAKIFGFDSTADLIGYPEVNLYYDSKKRGALINIILNKGHVEELPLPFKKNEGTPIWCAVTARAVFDDDGIVVFLDGLMRDITQDIEEQERSTEEKFQGVLEMAGGVAHRLNQPLTIINNILNEILSDLHDEDQNHQRIIKVHSQIQKLNAIVKKIGGIKKYKAMDYVAGIKIVDIDKAS
ncbi:MAG: PAS domain-containing protein [Desulfobacteraceae bacterium]|nr:MAG: PAS domain-containing protein [Desulfobacteraceae bacterium]